MVELYNVDRGILYELQRDARNTTAQQITETVGVSSSTVRNRIDHLEEVGVIEGYHPKINYEAAHLSLQVLFVATAAPEERAEVMDRTDQRRSSSSKGYGRPVLPNFETRQDNQNYVSTTVMSQSEAVRRNGQLPANRPTPRTPPFGLQ